MVRRVANFKEMVVLPLIVYYLSFVLFFFGWIIYPFLSTQLIPRKWSKWWTNLSLLVVPFITLISLLVIYYLIPRSNLANFLLVWKSLPNREKLLLFVTFPLHAFATRILSKPSRIRRKLAASYCFYSIAIAFHFVCDSVSTTTHCVPGWGRVRTRAVSWDSYVIAHVQ